MDGSAGTELRTATTTTPQRPSAPARRWYRSRWVRIGLMAVLPLVLALAGTWFYLVSERYVSTDDAYVQADNVAISSDISGRVTDVLVGDNQSVRAGQILFRLDDRPFRIAVDKAQAQLASARLQVEGLRANYRQKGAELQAAQDTLSYQQREFDRQQQLRASSLASQAQLDQARHALDAARQQVVSAQQGIANVLASLGGNPNIATDQHPLVALAQAQLNQAELDLSHTVVTAPADGVVTKVNQLPAGDYLTAGNPAFMLVETGKLWIEANFKETELAHVEPGQAATVTVDTYSDTDFAGRVASVTPATGSEFSVLPPQNATGNWVKVVQRLPLRIAIEHPDASKPLRAGMSVAVSIDTHHENPIVARIDRFFGA
jgi:membrane fusion protein (multidrug efflux system)